MTVSDWVRLIRYPTRMKGIRTVVMAIVLVSVAQSIAGDEIDEIEKGLKHVELFSNCRPISVGVGDLSRDARRLRITEKRIRTIGELALRSQNLYSDAEGIVQPTIFLGISVLDNAFSIHVTFYKFVREVNLDIPFLAIAWQKSSTGTHAGDREFILSELSELMDNFLLDYLRENQRYCKNGSFTVEHRLPATREFSASHVRQILELMRIADERRHQRLKARLIFNLENYLGNKYREEPFSRVTDVFELRDYLEQLDRSFDDAVVENMEKYEEMNVEFGSKHREIWNEFAEQRKNEDAKAEMLFDEIHKRLQNIVSENFEKRIKETSEKKEPD